jgi:hypothetical protein
MPINIEPYEVDHRYDVLTDSIIVRVRRFYKDENNNIYFKRGIAFKITDEMMMQIAEGSPYPIRAIPKDRFEIILEEDTQGE